MAKQPSFFWPSYSDLMTSLFFVMLVLFILTIGVLVRQVRATQAQLDKIREIENAVKELPEEYFEYKEEFKKHVLNLNVRFRFGERRLEPESDPILFEEIKRAGVVIDSIVRLFENRKEFDVQYLVIIEGQASKGYSNPDDYRNNDVLSFQRALVLKNFWKSEGLDLENNPNCELIIAGSGEGGVPREPLERDSLNQRFLIHIIPKPGIIN